VYHTGIILFVVLVVGVVMLRSEDVVTAGMGLGIWCGGTIVHQLANLCWISAPLRGILPPASACRGCDTIGLRGRLLGITL